MTEPLASPVARLPLERLIEQWKAQRQELWPYSRSPQSDAEYVRYGRAMDLTRQIEDLAACLGAPQEQEHKDLREALDRIAAIEDCQCGHDDENCCERVGEPCATCIAAVALRSAVLPPSPQDKEP